MKLRHLIALTGLAYASYEIFRNRDTIKENVSETNKSAQRMKHDLDNIKSNMTIITNQLQNINKMSQDLSLNVRYFQKDMNAHLDEIKKSS